MTKKATIITSTLILFMLFVHTSLAQQNDYLLNLPNSTDFMSGYTTGIQSGARDVSGPFDLDGDGLSEILVADYTGGGRIHVIENSNADVWELVYSTPWLDSTATVNNARAIAGGDLDGDGNGEIMILTGHNFSDTNPNIENLPVGLYVFENVGNDDYGSEAASIYEFPDHAPSRWWAEQMDVADVDGDGQQEVYFANNAAGDQNQFDNWFILSVTGDIGSDFETWVEEVRISSRSDDFDMVSRGGGSPYGILPADLDGDGTHEISLHSWNNFNFTNIGVSGANSYDLLDASALNINLQASTEDDVSLFSGVVADIDGNGDDEVFYPNTSTGNVSILNYESGEDPLQVTSDNLIFEAIDGLSALGLTAGDLDGDGNMELIGTGPGYSAADFEGGTVAEWVNIVEFNGGDPEVGSNYSTVASIPVPSDNYDAFHIVNRLDGSTERIDNDVDASDPDDVVIGNANAEFASKLAYLGDPDIDGVYEVAFGVQGIPDTLYTIEEVATDSFVVTASVSNENRAFMRVLSVGGVAISIEDERIIVPDDYKLHANYPNPFNPTTTIGFTLPLDKAVSVRVFDISGRLIKTIVDNQVFSQGTHEVTWDGTSDGGNSVASGTYLYTLDYGNFRKTKTMTLIK